MTMEEIEPGEGMDFAVPIRALKPSTCNMLGRMLDHENVISNKRGLNRDWRGLAELADFNSEEIERFRSEADRTVHLLSLWQEKCLECPTVKTLCSYLEKIERYDVLDDLTTIFERDVSTFRATYGNVGTSQVPLQDPEVGTSAVGPVDDSLVPYTVDDVQRRNGVQQYDAYVCYTEEDQGFLLELRAELEYKHKLKLCFKDRDFLVGINETSAIINIIQRRCRRLLLVITPAFLRSPHLNFQYLYAQALSIEEQQRRIIPIIYKSCQLPSNFRFLARLDYTKNDIFQCFWERLVQSIRDAPLCLGPQSVMFPPLPGSSSHCPSLPGSCSNLGADDVSGYGTLSGSMELMPIDTDDSDQKFDDSSVDYFPPSPVAIRPKPSTLISFKPKTKRKLPKFSLGRTKQS